MKKLVVLTIMFATAFSVSAKDKGPRHNINHNCIHVITMNNEFFCFKSDRDVAGAAITVYDFQTKQEVIADTITSKTMVLNLSLQKPADYIILITKGDFVRRYVFEKK